MRGRQLRDRDAVALDLVGVLGLTAFLLGLTWLRTDEKLGFEIGGAFEGVVSQLAITLPAALLVLAPAALELAAGLVLARTLRRRPFDSVAEALLAAMVAAVLKDAVLLGTLAAGGLFRAPILIAINVALIAAGLWLRPVSRHVLPLTAFGSWRDALGSIGSVPLAALVVIVWIGPVVLQLASPVVPFIDVLPNHVAPVEHLRTFGWLSPLTATQSPIYGSSRTVLGYDGLLGSLATMTGISGGLAIAGFILPQTVLVAAGACRLASALGGSSRSIGAWALLAFALSQPFARLADVRGTVVVIPLVCLGLALAAERLATRRGPPDADPVDAWRFGPGVVIGFALGAATMVHPVLGFFAIATVGIVGLLRPRELAADAFVAALTASLITLPQLATMVGVTLPTIALGIGLPLAIALGLLLGREVSRRAGLRDGLVRLARLCRIVLLVTGIGAIGVAFAISMLNFEKVPDALGEGVTLAVESSGLLLVALVVGAALGSPGARNPLIWAGLAVGVVAVLLTQVLPRDLGFLGSALRFELPKTVHYWLSTVAAAGAAAGLAHLWSTGRLPWLARVGAIAAFIAVAALPLRPQPIDAYHLGEHRFSETFAIDLRFAERGFWSGYPDTRTVVDAPRQAILDALRAEIDAGRIAHDTPVLHIASTFQQWTATPLGAFDGVFETSVSLEPELSHHTVGGRLFGLERLPEFLASGEFGYVVLEPNGLPGGIRDAVLASGYTSIFANEQGEVFSVGT